MFYSVSRLASLLFTLLISSQLIAQSAAPAFYHFNVDLRKVSKDRLTVELQIPGMDLDQVNYNMPKIVPGTYSISDFGRFVQNFKAFDSLGKALPVKRIGDNTWQISQAKTLRRITYHIDDTWEGDGTDNVIFEPAGSNIEARKNFVLNTFAVFGYFDGLVEKPYEVTFLKPTQMYGSTSLIASQSTDSSDVFYTEDYHLLADSPIMYCEPDTALLNIGGAEILVSVYSPNDAMDAQYIAKSIREILTAQQAYLGGELPIKKYAFIYYFTDKTPKSGMMGALEHSYSSLYFLQEVPKVFRDYLAQTIKDIAAHEFFHIVTPLNIHSEQIHNFDYINPEMSKHLWLYEGVTEYFASHVQVKYNIIPFDAYLNVLESKIINSAEQYNRDLAFTEMSKGCLDQYKDEYGNVYEKGALIGMCVDILLRDYSDGKYGLIDMMQDLSKEYGKDKPFKDDELFDQIAEITGQPEIRAFFTQYVEGNARLPLKEVFERVGLSYKESAEEKEFSLGSISLVANDNGQVYVGEVAEEKDIAERYKFEKEDIITHIDGVEVDQDNFVEVLYGKSENWENDEKFVMQVIRKNKKGKEKSKKLKAKALIETKKVTHKIEAIEEPTPRQQDILRAWIGDVE